MLRIAIPCESGQVFQRFGHAPQFKFYDIDGGSIIREQIIDTPPKKGHVVLGGFLKKMSTDVLICDRIGDGGKRELESGKIKLYTGVSGNADDAVKKYINGSLTEKDPANSKKKLGVQLDMPLSFY